MNEENEQGDLGWDDPGWDDPDTPDEPEYYYCLACGWSGLDYADYCPRCDGLCVEGVY